MHAVPLITCVKGHFCVDMWRKKSSQKSNFVCQICFFMPICIIIVGLTCSKTFILFKHLYHVSQVVLWVSSIVTATSRNRSEYTRSAIWLIECLSELIAFFRKLMDQQKFEGNFTGFTVGGARRLVQKTDVTFVGESKNGI